MEPFSSTPFRFTMRVRRLFDPKKFYLKVLNIYLASEFALRVMEKVTLPVWIFANKKLKNEMRGSW
jgi:hypothetical protein